MIEGFAEPRRVFKTARQEFHSDGDARIVAEVHHGESGSDDFTSVAIHLTLRDGQFLIATGKGTEDAMDKPAVVALSARDASDGTIAALAQAMRYIADQLEQYGTV